ncbi:MAG: hypothetical protein MUF14_01825 [Hyphomonadaceae bacterium]|jgi:hypothetical protein|nr:hypothetical protein [Hyphomonadaceae bacterium]
MVEGSATSTTSFTLATVAGQAITQSVYISDGRARTVNFTTDLSSQVIKRTEQDGNWNQGDPSPPYGFTSANWATSIRPVRKPASQ